MDRANVANLLGALATLIADRVDDAVAGDPRTLAEQTALVLLSKYPAATIEQLRGPLELSHSGCVRLVDRLARDGLVTRTSSDDGRAVALRLTRAGHGAARSRRDARGRLLDELLSALSAAEQAELGRLAYKLVRGATPDVAHAANTCRLCDYGACRRCPMRELA